jgi:hypothetical protein
MNILKLWKCDTLKAHFTHTCVKILQQKQKQAIKQQQQKPQHIDFYNFQIVIGFVQNLHQLL